jgi:hypothetical protein
MLARHQQGDKHENRRCDPWGFLRHENQACGGSEGTTQIIGIFTLRWQIIGGERDAEATGQTVLTALALV